MLESWGLLPLLAALLAATAFFEASESALFSLGRLRLKELEERHPRLGGQVRVLLQDPQGLLTTILFASTLVNVAFSSLATAWIMGRFAGGGLWEEMAAGLGVLAVMLVLGEAVPKAVAVTLPDRLALWAVVPLAFCKALLQPLLSRIRIGRYGPRDGGAALSGEELAGLLDLAAGQGALGPAEAAMAKAAIQLGRRRVREIMVPRVEVAFFRLGRPREELEALFRDTRYSRVPACAPTIDHVQGVIHARDFFGRPGAEPAALVRPLRFVPEQMTVERLLREFQERRETHAVAVDEHGGTAGYVALEDAVEAIVGPIRDEGEEGPAVLREGDGQVRTTGALPLRDWNASLRPRLPDGEGYDTLGGFLLSRLGAIPAAGARLEHRGAVFTVLRVRRGRVLDLRASGVRWKEPA